MEDSNAASRPWADLPADIVCEIAGHVHEAGDFVRFHAVCRPWREAPPPPPSQTHSSFLPCLIEQTLFDTAPENLHLYSPFARKPRQYTRTSSCLRVLAGKMLKSSGAASGHLLTVDSRGNYQALLVNPLTGDVTTLPPLPRATFRSYLSGSRCPSGLVSNDGVAMFHSRISLRSLFGLVLLEPGGTRWYDLDVSTCLNDLGFHSVQDLDDHTGRVLALLCSSDRSFTRAMVTLPPALPNTTRYVVESLHGELLCLDLLGLEKAKSPALMSIAVHSLGVRSNDDDDDKKPQQWVKKQSEHGRDIIDEHVCLFLDKNDSGFAIDAREFGCADEVTGGCAYFVDDHPTQTMAYAVWRYSFRDGTATVVDELPVGFGITRTCMWYMPRPRISALRSRLKKRGNDGYIEPLVRSRPRLEPSVQSQCA